MDRELSTPSVAKLCIAEEMTRIRVETDAEQCGSHNPSATQGNDVKLRNGRTGDEYTYIVQEHFGMGTEIGRASKVGYIHARTSDKCSAAAAAAGRC